MKFYQKEMCSNPVMGLDGKSPVQFECFPSDTGVLALDEGRDAGLIAHLDDFASKRKGGIVKISQEDFDQIKKNRGGSPTFVAPSREYLRVMKAPSLFKKPENPASPAAAANGHAAAPSPGPVGESTAPDMSKPPGPAPRPAKARKSEVAKPPTGKANG
jgi:hypothetical protein